MLLTSYSVIQTTDCSRRRIEADETNPATKSSPTRVQIPDGFIGGRREGRKEGEKERRKKGRKTF